MNEWMDESLVNEWMKKMMQWMNAKMNEWMHGMINEWMN